MAKKMDFENVILDDKAKDMLTTLYKEGKCGDVYSIMYEVARSNKLLKLTNDKCRFRLCVRNGNWYSEMYKVTDGTITRTELICEVGDSFAYQEIRSSFEYYFCGQQVVDFYEEDLIEYFE